MASGIASDVDPFPHPRHAFIAGQRRRGERFAVGIPLETLDVDTRGLDSKHVERIRLATATG